MNDVFEDFPLCLSRLRNQDSVCEDTDLILGLTGLRLWRLLQGAAKVADTAQI